MEALAANAARAAGLEKRHIPSGFGKTDGTNPPCRTTADNKDHKKGEL